MTHPFTDGSPQLPPSAASTAVQPQPLPLSPVCQHRACEKVSSVVITFVFALTLVNVIAIYQPQFQVGSGASGYTHGSNPNYTQWRKGISLNSIGQFRQNTRADLRQLISPVPAPLSIENMHHLLWWLAAAAAAATVICMMNADRGAGGNRDFNYRVPPSWTVNIASVHT